MRDFEREDEPKPLLGLLAGAAAGLLGAWAMNQFQSAWSKAAEKIESAEQGERRQQGEEEKQSTGEEEDATMKAAGKIAHAVLGRELTRQQKQKAGPIVHYGVRLVSGAIYGMLSEYIPMTRVGFGTGFGAVLFLLGDEIAVPALKLSQKPTELPLSSHINALASHFVYGASTEAARRGIRRAA